LKRRGQNRGNTAILTSSPYFKEWRDESNSTLDSNRRHLPLKRQLFGKCGAESKKQLKKSTPDGRKEWRKQGMHVLWRAVL
jgi:hypothetical protein